MGLQAALYNLLLQWGQPWGRCAGLYPVRSWKSLRTEPAQPLWATCSTAGLGKKCFLISEEAPQHFWMVHDHSTHLIEILIVNCDASSDATVYFRCSVTAGNINIDLTSKAAAVYTNWRKYAWDAKILCYIINIIGKRIQAF